MSNQAKIAELRAQADRLEEEDRKFNLLPNNQRVAIQLHSMLCHWNHMDGCGWEYEGSNGKPDWRGSAHQRWLAKADKLIAHCSCHNIDIDTAVEIIKISKEL